MADANPPGAGALAARVLGLECEVGRLRETISLLQESGGASSALDAARARKLNAEAERIEREIVSDYGLSPDDGVSPVVACSWTVETVKSADGTPSIVLHLIGDGSRAHQVALSISLASSLGGGLSEAVALALIEAQRER